jgi:hypothetical protein
MAVDPNQAFKDTGRLVSEVSWGTTSKFIGAL